MECIICLEEYPEEEILKFCEDKHIYCKECFEEYVKKVGREDNLECPYCRSEIKIGREEVSIINGKKEGLYRKYFRSGELNLECNYEDNKKVGLLRRWFKDGVLNMEINYINDKKEGISKEWYNNGQLKLIMNWKHDIENGFTEKWYPNGKKEYEYNIKAGQFDGVMKAYLEDGTLVFKGEYEGGMMNGIIEIMNNNGKIREVYQYRKNVKIYEAKYYDNKSTYFRAYDTHETLIFTISMYIGMLLIIMLLLLMNQICILGVLSVILKTLKTVILITEFIYNIKDGELLTIA